MKLNIVINNKLNNQKNERIYYSRNTNRKSY